MLRWYFVHFAYQRTLPCPLHECACFPLLIFSRSGWWWSKMVEGFETPSRSILSSAPRQTTLAGVLLEAPTFPHGRLPSDLIKSFTLAIAHKLCELHEAHRSHGGLSLESILITERGGLMLGALGPFPKYFSPERRQSTEDGHPPTIADDVWALGCIVLQMVENRCTGVLPPILPLGDQTLSEQGLQFINCLLAEHPESRVTAAQICETPFFSTRQSFFSQNYRRRPKNRRPSLGTTGDSESQTSHQTSARSYATSMGLQFLSGCVDQFTTPQRAVRAFYGASQADTEPRSLGAKVPSATNQPQSTNPPTPDALSLSLACKEVMDSCNTIVSHLEEAEGRRRKEVTIEAPAHTQIGSAIPQMVSPVAGLQPDVASNAP